MPVSGALPASSRAPAAGAQARVHCMKSNGVDSAQAGGSCTEVRFCAPRPLQLLGALPPCGICVLPVHNVAAKMFQWTTVWCSLVQSWEK